MPSQTVAIKLTNNQTGGSLLANVSVGGHERPIGEAFAGATPTGTLGSDRIVVSVIEVQKPAEATGLSVVIIPPQGPSLTVDPNGTPLKVNNGAPLDITTWGIFITPGGK